MKRFVMGLIVGIAISVCGAAYAEDGLQKIEAYLRPNLPITLNGQAITLSDSPVMVDGNTYIRLRNLQQVDPNLQVNWNESTQTVELSTYGTQQTPVTTTPTTTTPTGGTPVTTTTSTSSNDGQISKLKDDIQAQNNLLITTNAGINVLKQRLEDSSTPDDIKKILNENLAGEQTKIQEIQNKIADLEAQLASLQGK